VTPVLRGSRAPPTTSDAEVWVPAVMAADWCVLAAGKVLSALASRMYWVDEGFCTRALVKSTVAVMLLLVPEVGTGAFMGADGFV